MSGCTAWTVRGLIGGILLMAGASDAVAQPIGTFRWQLQPFCNIVTLAVTQSGGVYRLDGTDDQCGAATASAAVGTAFQNPNASIGMGLTVVRAPGGGPVHVDATFTLPSLNGTWRDSAGNTGTFVLTPGAGIGGPPRPSGGALVGRVTAGAGLSGGGTGEAVALNVAFGADGAAPLAARSDHEHSGPGQASVSVGPFALAANTGLRNTAVGDRSLATNTTGSNNTAVGGDSLVLNTSGSDNTGIGTGALTANTIGFANTAVGRRAGTGLTTGSFNVILGAEAGTALTGGSNNILIRHPGDAANEINTIRIGSNGHTRAFIGGVRGRTTAPADAVPLLISSAGQLGTTSSSRRVKQDIADMNGATRLLHRLRPVTFRYIEHAAAGSTRLEYGLIAEEVAEVYPDLVVRRADGSIETVQYQKLAPMLLNEVQRLEREIRALRAEIAAAGRK